MPIQVNPFRFGAGAAPSGAFIGAVELTTNVATYTFSSVPIGTAAADRLVVVGVIVHDTGDQNGIDSVTLDGIGMTEVEDTSSAGIVGEDRVAGIFSLVDTTGTTGTVVVNCPNPATSCGIAVWALYPTSTTPLFSSSVSSAGSTGFTGTNLSIQSGGTLVAIHAHQNGNATTWTWSGVDSEVEQFDEAIGDSGNNWSALTIPCSETNATGDLGVSWTGSVNACLAAASWGP